MTSARPPTENDRHRSAGRRRWPGGGLGTLGALALIAAGALLVYTGRQATPGQKRDDSRRTRGDQSVDRPSQRTGARRRATGGAGKGLNARRAFGYLVRICRIGPRISGTGGMAKQQKLIAKHFNEFGAQVRFQSFDAQHPRAGTPVRMNNIVVSWDKEAEERVLLACHYDTRPFPDRDPVNPRGTFIGANDGASGVALLMELAHHMKGLEPTYGVDFVFFDGEELVYGPNDKYFLGSEHFARQYRDHPPDYRYVYGVLVDMIGDRRLNIYKEENSVDYAPRLVESIWQTAGRLGVREFIDREKYEIRDDHLPLNDIAKIPTCDIIDFDYGPPRRPYWHTTLDVPSKCSGASLVKVGRVLLEWLTEVPPPQKDDR